MTLGFVIIVSALAYIGALFLIAYWGDRARPREAQSRSGLRVWIYPLSLAVYCTSWTFFGSVGLSSRQGFDFLAIYLGPILAFALFWPFFLRIIRIAKSQNITSIADFIGARYGKSQLVAAVVCAIVTVGTVPYVALQLKAVSSSLITTLEPERLVSATRDLPFFGDLALLVAMTMAAFAMLFGTRHADATEHQEGMMLAVAAESIVKLVCFLVVGVYVTYVIHDGFADLFRIAASREDISRAILRPPDVSAFAAMSLLSFFCAFMLPRMFHVAVVENHSEGEVRRAAWLFPAYLVAINLFVVPIAIAGLAHRSAGAFDTDMTVIALPLAHGADLVTLAAFLGGLSAATAMVIVACVALAIMISNDIVIPSMIKLRGYLPRHVGLGDDHADVGATILTIRRTIILFVLLAAYLYYRIAGDAQLAAIGLLSFAAVAQLAPAFFGGLFWRRATARGAVLGMGCGLAVWAYTLLLPMLARAGVVDPAILAHGLFGLSVLRPQSLVGLDLDPLANGVIASLVVNATAFVLGSLSRRPRPIETMQAALFAPHEVSPYAPSFRLWRSSVPVGELQRTVGRYLGPERAEVSFLSFFAERRIVPDPDAEADIELLRYAEKLLASAIGTASSRLVLSLLLKKRSVSTHAALKLLDDANAALQYNREVLQTALEHARQGVSVFAADGALMVWNKPFAEVLALDAGALRYGVSLESVLGVLAARGEFGAGDVDGLARDLAAKLLAAREPFRERLQAKGLVIEIRSARLPDGGVVATYTDVTEAVAAEEALERANERLEQRVRERTEELTLLNRELAKAKAEADEANISKTRFLAAASHDILQPLNAARLYATSLVNRSAKAEQKPDATRDSDGALVEKLDASLESVEEILAALLDISRLDAGAMKPEPTAFRLDDLLRQLAVEFAPMAAQKNLNLRFARTSAVVMSDRRLLRRILQNLISNGIKYTAKGGVLVGCRRRGSSVLIQVLDTGSGIPSAKHKLIFQEFQRLEQGAKAARGLGLGLSIVERMARVLGHGLTLRSDVGKGSVFSLDVPSAVVAPDAEMEPPRAARGPSPVDGLVVVAIDNEPRILEGMGALLGGWGCRVHLGADAHQAEASLDAAGLVPDALLVDYHLDDTTGLEAIRALRARYGTGLPAILITADRTLAVREQAAAAGVVVLHKPVKPAAMRALLAQVRVRASTDAAGALT